MSNNTWISCSEMNSTITGVWIDVGKRKTKLCQDHSFMIVVSIPRMWILDAVALYL